VIFRPKGITAFNINQETQSGLKSLVATGLWPVNPSAAFHTDENGP
jgi:hypothetical protein